MNHCLKKMKIQDEFLSVRFLPDDLEHLRQPEYTCLDDVKTAFVLNIHKK